MYQEANGNRKTMGDVDVIFHEGIYHLFHLVLPNHDFIAHAVSDDGLSWSRVENALFIGHPGSWDDSMLWTMHVSKDPFQPGGWRMFYTGISQCDDGLVQRIGLARSEDLYAWTKSPVSWVSRCERCRLTNLPASNLTAKFDQSSRYPLEAKAPYYESSLDEGRRWVSWRDPYFFCDGDQGWLLAAGRVPEGPVVRRGCVAVMKEVEPDHFEVVESLFHPGLYDDIEVPNLLKIEEQYYLIGSIREDAKIRYWHTTELGKPWTNYYDNVLLPKGNYAGRICRDEQGLLIWNFFSHDITNRQVKNILPPPKRLLRNGQGRLQVVSFEGFDKLVSGRIPDEELYRVKKLQSHENGTVDVDASHRELRLCSPAGFQAFLLGPNLRSFRFQARMKLKGTGKCGIVFRINEVSHDGYYLSLDLIKGVAQLRAWGSNSAATGEHVMQFASLQAGYWNSDYTLPCEISLIAAGGYVEFSVNGSVLISLADEAFSEGKLGIYAESASLEVDRMVLEKLREIGASSEELVSG